MICIEVLYESDVITLLLLARSLQNIWHSSATWYISSILCSWNNLLSRHLRSIESSRVSFLIYNLLNGLRINWVLKLISLCVINAIVQRFKSHSSARYLLLLVVGSSQIRRVIVSLVRMWRWRNVLIDLLVTSLLRYLILKGSLLKLGLHWKGWNTWQLSWDFSSIHIYCLRYVIVVNSRTKSLVWIGLISWLNSRWVIVLILSIVLVIIELIRPVWKRTSNDSRRVHPLRTRNIISFVSIRCIISNILIKYYFTVYLIWKLLNSQRYSFKWIYSPYLRFSC